MKLIWSLLVCALLVSPATTSVKAAEAVSLDVFYDNLDEYGSWQEVGDYGYCWRPRNVDENWRPYSDGKWVYTDAGWTWDSEEPFGWAVYHYGRWANVDQIGWIWVPGTEWGPAWVSWRHSSRYVGWAPLPPEAIFSAEVGISTWADSYYDIGPANYSFVELRNFGTPRVRTVFVDRRDNINIINETVNITNITYEHNMIHGGGPRFEEISRDSEHPISRYKLERREGFEGRDQLRSRVQGGSFSVFAAPVSRDSRSLPKKLAASLGSVQVNHGWKSAGSAEQVAKAREKINTTAKVPESLPARPVFDRSIVNKPRGSSRPPGTPVMPIDKTQRAGEPPVGTPEHPAKNKNGGPMHLPEKPESRAEKGEPRPGAKGSPEPRGQLGSEPTVAPEIRRPTTPAPGAKNTESPEIRHPSKQAPGTEPSPAPGARREPQPEQRQAPKAVPEMRREPKVEPRPAPEAGGERPAPTRGPEKPEPEKKRKEKKADLLPESQEILSVTKVRWVPSIHRIFV